MNISTKSLINVCVLILVGFAMGMVASHWKFEHRGPRGFGPPHHHGERGDKREHEDRMLKMFTNRLNLDDKQQEKVKSILSQGGERLKALHTQTKPKFEEIRTDIESQLRAIMVGEQIEKFDELQEEMKKRPRPPGPRPRP